MEYSIKNLAKLSGVSTRTLRYYDEIGLLKPLRINSSGYRIYSEKQIDILQQILFYKTLDLSLQQINQIINDSNFDVKTALYEHKKNILIKQKQLNKLLINIERTINSLEGGATMSAEEKFEGFKNEIIKENEKKYGEEIRKKYGEDEVISSYSKFKNLSKTQLTEVENLSNLINTSLKEAMSLGDIYSDKAKDVVRLHKKWLSFFGNYSKEAHISLGEMYVSDPRFTNYYEKNVGIGAAIFLRDCIKEYYK